MTNRKGPDWELDILKDLRLKDWSVERLRLAGIHDEGDLVVRMRDYHFVIEAKNEKQFSLATYVKELEQERLNYGYARKLPAHLVHGAVVLKRPRHNVLGAYVIKTLADEMALWQELVP